jgi:hypothetical protein
MRIRFEFGSVTLDAELLDTPTARAIAAALPISADLGRGGLFRGPGRSFAREGCAGGRHAGRDRVLAGRPRDRHRLRAHADLEGR